MNDVHHGYVVNTLWDTINMLTKLQRYKPQRFEEFQYSQETIYHYIDRLQHEQHLYD
jgi:hypothetical protein